MSLSTSVNYTSAVGVCDGSAVTTVVGGINPYTYSWNRTTGGTIPVSTVSNQSGNIFPGFTPRFVGPEWGNVKPFSLDKNNIIINKFNNLTIVYDFHRY